MTSRTATKTYIDDSKNLFGLTFYSDYQHLENSWHYEIFVRVPDDHIEESGRIYETIDGVRTAKIASQAYYKDESMAVQEMIIKIGELLTLAQIKPK
jgi:hypothetical protein